MKFKSSNRAKLVLLAAFLATWRRGGCAADFDEPESSGWYARAGAMARFNVKASLKASTPVLSPGYYDDGFVLPDIGKSEVTSNWGYNDPSQVVGPDLVFHRYDSVPAVGDQDLNVDNPMIGGEAVVGYRFLDLKLFGLAAHLGAEFGYSYTEFSQDMSFGAVGAATYRTDTRSLHGSTPPLAPYAGNDSSVGISLGVPADSSTTVSSTASTAFHGKLDTTLQSVRIGPSFEMDLVKNLTLGFGAGYSSVYVDASLSYTQTTTFDNPAVPTINSGSVNRDRSEWEPGFYFEMRADYQFTHHIAAFLGGDFQYNRSMEFGDESHEVKIDLGSTYAAKAGVLVRF